MPMTQNPFERHSGKAEAAKPDTIENLRAKITGNPASLQTANPPEATKRGGPSAQVGGGLPPTRKSETAAGKSGGPAAAGFQRANPFQNTQKHAPVSNTGPRHEDAASWDPKKAPPAPGPKPNKAPEQVNDKAPEQANGKVPEPISGDNYQEHYKREQELAAEQQRKEEEEKRRQTTVVQQQKIDLERQQQKLAEDANKARDLLSKKGQLEQQMGGMSEDQRRGAYFQLDEIRVALAQLQYYG